MLSKPGLKVKVVLVSPMLSPGTWPSDLNSVRCHHQVGWCQTSASTYNITETSHLTPNPSRHPTAFSGRGAKPINYQSEVCFELSGLQSLNISKAAGCKLQCRSIVRRGHNMISYIANYARLMCLVSLNDLVLDLYNFDPNIKVGNSTIDLWVE